MTAVVARPQRTRHAGRRQMGLALAHQRLMLLLILFGIGTAVVAGRLVALSFAPGAHASRVAVAGLADFAANLHFHRRKVRLCILKKRRPMQKAQLQKIFELLY